MRYHARTLLRRWLRGLVLRSVAVALVGAVLSWLLLEPTAAPLGLVYGLMWADAEGMWGRGCRRRLRCSERLA